MLQSRLYTCYKGGEILEISIIAAVGENGEIGYQNKLLWNIKEDMKWFRYHTMNKPVIMGRATYDSIGKPLKGRLNVVLSRDEDLALKLYPDVLVANNIEKILHELRNEKEVMVIGGQQVYSQFLSHASRLYLTEVNKGFTADTFFPAYDPDDWFECFTKDGEEVVGFDYTFKVYKKKLK
jgi:dihydrofolate reductase